MQKVMSLKLNPQTQPSITITKYQSDIASDMSRANLKTKTEKLRCEQVSPLKLKIPGMTDLYLSLIAAAYRWSFLSDA